MTTYSGNFPGVDDGQARVPAVHVTKRRLTLEQERRTFFAQTTMGGGGGHMAAIASGNLSDVPSPTALMTDSGALLVKNALVHISLSTPSLGVAGKIATDPSLISAARPTQ